MYFVSTFQQNTGPIAQSKADVASYCLEVQKKLGMRYVAPSLPVNIGIAKSMVHERSILQENDTGEDSNAPAQSSVPDFSFLAPLFAKPDEAKKTR